MGNHASSGERRPKPGDHGQVKMEGQAFNFGHNKMVTQPSEEEPFPILPPKPSDQKDPAVEVVPPAPRAPIGLIKSKEKMLPCVIKWRGGGQNVALTGAFNQWQNLTMVKSEEDFIAIVDLPQGKHEYKFLVDGDWKTDPKERVTENNLGTHNNYISVEQCDFEELENALMKDPNDKRESQTPLGKPASSSAPKLQEMEDEYSQEIPEFQLNEKSRGPPALPPHLLQVILNKDTPVSIEPTLLPEPNHVMLNHMYALSIRDGLMVLSTSHRFKKKCITTLIYRPI